MYYSGVDSIERWSLFQRLLCTAIHYSGVDNTVLYRELTLFQRSKLEVAKITKQLEFVNFSQIVYLFVCDLLKIVQRLIMSSIC